MTREQQQGRSYTFTYTSQDEKLIIWKMVDQDFVKLGEADCTMDIDRWYTWRLKFEGSQISLYVNGTCYIDTVDDEAPYAYASGQISLHTSSAKADFDNIKVYDFVQSLNVDMFKDSEYIFAFSTVAESNDELTIKIDGEEYLLKSNFDSEDSGWRYTPSINLTQGQHTVSIPYQVNEKIKQLVVFSISRNEEVSTVNDIFRGAIINPIVEYEKLEAEEYIVKVNASRPFETNS